MTNNSNLEKVAVQGNLEGKEEKNALNSLRRQTHFEKSIQAQSEQIFQKHPQLSNFLSSLKQEIGIKAANEHADDEPVSDQILSGYNLIDQVSTPATQIEATSPCRSPQAIDQTAIKSPDSLVALVQETFNQVAEAKAKIAAEEAAKEAELNVSPEAEDARLAEEQLSHHPSSTLPKLSSPLVQNVKSAHEALAITSTSSDVEDKNKQSLQESVSQESTTSTSSVHKTSTQRHGRQTSSDTVINYLQNSSSNFTLDDDSEEESAHKRKVNNLLQNYVLANKYNTMVSSLYLQEDSSKPEFNGTLSLDEVQSVYSQDAELIQKQDKTKKTLSQIHHYLHQIAEVSFTHVLPVPAYQCMLELICTNHNRQLFDLLKASQVADDAAENNTISDNQRNYGGLIIPPIVHAFNYEQLLTQESLAISKTADMMMSWSYHTHAYIAIDEYYLDYQELLDHSYDLPADLSTNMPIWKQNTFATNKCMFNTEPDLAVTREVHKTLDYVIHHHEKFKHDNHPELLTCIGRWCFDRAEGGFFIDKGGAKLFGLKEGHVKLSFSDLLNVFAKSHVERIIHNQNNPEAGDIISDRLMLISGPYAGKSLITQGAVIMRDPETNMALFSSGFLCYEYCPNADFLCREIMGDGMFIWDLDNDNIIVSPSYHLMLGYTKEEFPTKTEDFAKLLVHPDDDDAIRIQHLIVRSPIYGNSFESCIRLRHKNGNYIWTIGRGVVLERNSQGMATKIIGSQSNIDLVHKSFENIGDLMFTDSLTELHNRSYLTQNAIRFENNKVFPMSILFVDVTGLKLTNDILGHNFGDYLILKCAIALIQALQNILDRFHLFTEFKKQLSVTIDHLTHKAFAQIFQNKDLLEKAEKLASKNNEEIRLHHHNPASFAGMTSNSEQVLNIEPETIEKMLQLKMMPEVLRLSGDELLLLFPSCSHELALQLEKECFYTAKKMNAIDRISFPISQRPVPLCFGVGCATVGELREDSFQKALERADMRMLQNKEANQEQCHKQLQEYFEARLNRKVSMRDERRTEILTENERRKIREMHNQQHEHDEYTSLDQEHKHNDNIAMVTLPQLKMKH